MECTVALSLTIVVVTSTTTTKKHKKIESIVSAIVYWENYDVADSANEPPTLLLTDTPLHSSVSN